MTVTHERHETGGINIKNNVHQIYIIYTLGVHNIIIPPAEAHT